MKHKSEKTYMGAQSACVTLGFKDKTECIAICMLGSSFIHIETL